MLQGDLSQLEMYPGHLIEVEKKRRRMTKRRKRRKREKMKMS